MRQVLTLVALAAAMAGPARAQTCENPQEACGALVEAQCLSALGAGVIAAGEATACAAQMTAYRDCLSTVIETCPATVQQASGASPAALELEELAALGGLVAEPATIAEHYNNAVVYARRGDALSQRKMLEKAITLGADSVDLHLRYVQLLKAQEGLVGAREILRDLARTQSDNRGLALAAATIAPEPEREPALRALVAGDDPFGPAWFELAALVSEERLGKQTIGDQRAEKAALDAFAAADEAGKFYRWFIEKDTAELWRESARRRAVKLAALNLEAPDVSATAQASNDSWMVTLVLREAATAIRYRVDGGEIRDTGLLDFVSPETGKPTPRPFLTLPLGTERATIDVWYDDRSGAEKGPFPVAFDAAAAHVTAAKSILEGMITNWVEGRDWDGGRLVYFTTLISYRCGLTGVTYGVDVEAPDTAFPLAPCNPKNPYAIPEGQEVYLRFEKPFGFVSVRLDYADGTQSETRRFDIGKD